MAVRLSIPTLQEYARKRRVLNSQEISDCESCKFCRSSLNVCIFGENIRSISNLKVCPMTQSCLNAVQINS